MRNMKIDWQHVRPDWSSKGTPWTYPRPSADWVEPIGWRAWHVVTSMVFGPPSTEENPRASID